MPCGKHTLQLQEQFLLTTTEEKQPTELLKQAGSTQIDVHTNLVQVFLWKVKLNKC